MTKETAEFLLNVVNMLSVSANDPDFEKVARQVVAAKTELSEIIVAGMAEVIEGDKNDG